MKKILVVGLGKLGRTLAESLSGHGAEVLAVDSQKEFVEDVQDVVAFAAQLDATDADALRSIEAERVDAAVVTMGEDFEASALAVAALREIGVPRIVARARNAREAKILGLAGATQTIVLEQEVGRRLALQLLWPQELDAVQLARGYSVVPWVAAGSLVGRTLADSGLRSRWGLQVIGVRRAGAQPGVGAEVPAPDHVISAGEVLLLVGTDEALVRFRREAGG